MRHSFCLSNTGYAFGPGQILMAEPEENLLQSLDEALEESRRLRTQSTLLLEKAQWPVIETAPREETPPIPDLLRMPVAPLLGFQRDRGNLPARQPDPPRAPPV